MVFFERINLELNKPYRAEIGKEPAPSVPIAVGQTAATSSVGGPAGYDGNKRKQGRKRNVPVDGLGLLWFLHINTADIHDTKGAQAMFGEAKGNENLKSVKTIFADAGYKGEAVESAAAENGWKIEIVTGEKGKFVVVKKRWIVEKTFGWLPTSRRWNRDYERTIESSETMLFLRMIRLTIRKLSIEREKKWAA
jgi:transposase